MTGALAAYNIMPTRMRLSCHLLACGQFYPAGSEIPPEVVVPGRAMQYVIPDENDLLHGEVSHPSGTAVPVNTPEATSHPSLISL